MIDAVGFLEGFSVRYNDVGEEVGVVVGDSDKEDVGIVVEYSDGDNVEVGKGEGL